MAIPNWSDKPVAIVAGGKTLEGFDFSRLRDKFHILAVKATIFDIPYATAGFGLDFPRYQSWRDEGKFNDVKFPVYWAFGETHWVQECGTFHECIVPLKRTMECENLEEDENKIATGGSSGFGALNLAYHARPKEIVLFGFDYGVKNTNIANYHHNDQHYSYVNPQSAQNWRTWATYFDYTIPSLRRAGIKIVNASPKSLITAFPRMTIDETLDLYRV